MSVSLLTHRGMSRQRKSRKFTYSLLSPGIFPFLLLLIPSPLPPIASPTCFDLLWFSLFLLKCVWLIKLGLSGTIKR